MMFSFKAIQPVMISVVIEVNHRRCQNVFGDGLIQKAEYKEAEGRDHICLPPSAFFVGAYFTHL